jgi:hypothetical protein
MKDNNTEKLAYSAPAVEVIAFQAESFVMASVNDYNDNVIC